MKLDKYSRNVISMHYFTQTLLLPINPKDLVKIGKIGKETLFALLDFGNSIILIHFDTGKVTEVEYSIYVKVDNKNNLSFYLMHKLRFLLNRIINISFI